MNAKTHQTQSGRPSLASLTPGADPSLPRAQGLYDPARSAIPAASASSPT